MQTINSDPNQSSVTSVALTLNTNQDSTKHHGRSHAISAPYEHPTCSYSFMWCACANDMEASAYYMIQTMTAGGQKCCEALKDNETILLQLWFFVLRSYIFCVLCNESWVYISLCFLCFLFLLFLFFVSFVFCLFYVINHSHQIVFFFMALNFLFFVNIL